MELAITGERLYWRTVDGLQNEVSVFPIQFDARDTGAATYYAVAGDNEEREPLDVRLTTDHDQLDRL
ncbi:hypothetical protein ITJ64_10520 [Herbiconiux sp. VKM Ac-1786]|uniref:hypothetical protein n=1 Tax=Herbiconiux sp. VKM Ac-1786 TaxID=2783824 RepID=UPI00188C2959|nr:hypothetical protein [Herbiconiux sp. VKM Ac-1786]MBF4572951.1 hypothetical protein [Herbiconiux sp. VKM Ac-1786]